MYITLIRQIIQNCGIVRILMKFAMHLELVEQHLNIEKMIFVAFILPDTQSIKTFSTC